MNSTNHLRNAKSNNVPRYNISIFLPSTAKYRFLLLVEIIFLFLLANVQER